MYTYKYPRPAVTTDSVVLAFNGRELQLLLIQRKNPPFQGSWALPGGFLEMDETAEQGAQRELTEETGLTNIFLEQLHLFSALHRDPRERVLTIAFLALIRQDDYTVTAGDDAQRAAWFSIEHLPELAFDHADIISMARHHLQQTLLTQPLAFRLLNQTFTMLQLRLLYQAINQTHYTPAAFEQHMLASGLLVPVNSTPQQLSAQQEPRFIYSGQPVTVNLFL